VTKVEQPSKPRLTRALIIAAIVAIAVGLLAFLTRT
jgi:uncharacterized protein involved in exopolysaccharide biosynthesis